jgi:hypothetical protein
MKNRFQGLFMLPISGNSKVFYAVALATVVIIIIDYFFTVDIDVSEFDSVWRKILFVLTVVIGYGLGTWFLLGYVQQRSTEIRSRVVGIMHQAVIIIQFFLLAITLALIYERNEILLILLFIVSSISASIVLGLLAFRFFSWYRIGKNLITLAFGLASAGLGVAISDNIATHSFVEKVIPQNEDLKCHIGPSSTGKGNGLICSTTSSSSKEAILTIGEDQDPTDFVKSYACNGENCLNELWASRAVLKDVQYGTTVFYIVQPENTLLRQYLNLIPYNIAYTLTWLCGAVLLRHYYPRTDKLKFWIIASLPLIFFLVGRSPNIFGFQAPPVLVTVSVTGVAAMSIVFGLALYATARKTNTMARSYLTISAIGITILPISLGVSVLEETFGLAAHSLVLLSSFLFSFGLYTSAISISHDRLLYQLIRKTAEDTSSHALLYQIATSQRRQEIEKRVLEVAKVQSNILVEESGIQPALEEEDIKKYMEQVITEIKMRTGSIKERGGGLS